MKEEPVTDALLRQFLLGAIDDAERQRLEKLFITDRLSRDRVYAAERDLIEDYLDDGLTSAEREKFVFQYAQTAEQQQQLRISKTIQEWATSEANIRQDAASRFSIWKRLRSPRVVMAFAVVALIAILVGIIWVNRRAAEQEQYAVEQELAQLNASASQSQAPAQMLSLKLSPGSVRGVEKQNLIETHPDIRIVELRLVLPRHADYQEYQAVIHRMGDGPSFTVAHLVPENDGTAVRLRIPTHILVKGLCQIELSGIADGKPTPSEEYNFTVGSKG